MGKVIGLGKAIGLGVALTATLGLVLMSLTPQTTENIATGKPFYGIATLQLRGFETTRPNGVSVPTLVLVRKEEGDQAWTFWELRRFQGKHDWKKTWDMCDFLVGDISFQSLTLLSGREVLTFAANKKEELEMETKFYTLLAVVKVIVTDLTRDGQLDLIIRYCFRKDEWASDTVVAYEVREGKAHLLWSYELRKDTENFSPLWGMDHIVTRNGVTEIFIFQPFDRMQVLRFEPLEHKYTTSQIHLSDLLPLWLLAICAFLTPFQRAEVALFYVICVAVFGLLSQLYQAGVDKATK